MMNSIKRFVREEDGVTMVEYGLRHPELGESARLRPCRPAHPCFLDAIRVCLTRPSGP